jgi:hypothetical protein
VTATAEILPLPGIRLVTAARLPVERREFLLRWLAERSLDLPPEVVALSVDAWSHDSICGPALELAWRDFEDKTALADAADRGCFDWRQLDPELSCGGRTEVAREVAHQDAEDALHLLARGSETNHYRGNHD